MSKGKKLPNEVFTPRAADVNPTMYIDRKTLETQLERALRGHQHVLIHGESGSGKTWLYRQVLKRMDAFPFPLGLSLAARLGSITAAAKAAVEREGTAKKTSYDETKSAGLNIPGVSGELEHAGHFEIGEKEPFEECLALARKKAGKALAVLVLDNLEAIFDRPDLMSELANLILLSDDPVYAKYNVRFALVGTPSEVRNYYAKTENLSSVANRIHEISEVSRLDEAQVADFVERGFIQELGYSIPQEHLREICRHVWWVTLGVPQRVQEYCLELADISHLQTVPLENLDDADWIWMSRHLWQAYECVASHMNDRATGVGRRNQVLYAVGQYWADVFRARDLEPIMRREFPRTAAGKALGIAGILAQLSGGTKPVLRRSEGQHVYTLADPLYRMCIRAMLLKNSDETIDALSPGSI